MTHQKTTLKNGLLVVSDTILAAQSVTLNIGVKVGSRYEPVALNGISHFLEHMAFKGTHRRTAKKIAEEMDAVGGYLNAYTDREHTVYTAKVLKEDINLAIDILADILQYSVFDPEELGKERGVIIQEIAQSHDTPDDIIFDYYQETAFPNQGLGRSILGTVESIATFDQKTFQRYVGDHYHANNMVISAAGHVTHQALVERLEATFTALTKSTPVPYSTPVYQGGGFYSPRTELEQAHIVIGFKGLSYCDPHYYAIQMLSIVLGGGMSSQLFQEVREKRGLAYSVQSFTSSYADTGTFAIYAGTGEIQVQELIPVICDELHKVCKHVKEEEMARARAQVKASLLMAQESSSIRADELLRNYLCHGRHIPTQEILDKIEAVTKEDIMALGDSLLRNHPPTIAAVGALNALESYEAIQGRLKP